MQVKAALAWGLLATVLLAALISSLLVGDYFAAAIDALLLALSPRLVRAAL